MRRFNLLLFVAVVAATTMVSCFKDEVILTPAITQESDVIGFVANVHDDDATRACRNRIGRLDLKSANGEFVLPMGVDVEDGIYGTADADTRGAKISSLKSFQVWGELTQGDGTKVNYIPGVDFGLDLGDENDKKDDNYDSNTIYPWPGEGTLNFVALGNAPASGLTANMNGTAVESFTYTVPASATAQNDIVVATLNDVLGSANSTQALDFKHIMSAVNFTVGEKVANGVIKSITINNIKTTGSYNVATGTWTPNTDKKDSYSVAFSSTVNCNYEPNDKANGTIINDGECTFMMMPQVLDADAEVVVEFIYDNATSDVKQLRANIAIDPENPSQRREWAMGKTTYYSLSVDENYNLTITPKGDVLDAHYVMTDVTVNIDTETDQAWTLTVEATNIDSDDVSIMFKEDLNPLISKEGYWIDKDNLGNVIRGGKELKGTATAENHTYTVTVFIPENITANERKITLTLKLDNVENAVKTEYLYQMCPYWDESKGFGWEKVENTDVGEFGFNWDRVVCYTYAYTVTTGSINVFGVNWATTNDSYDDFNNIVDNLINTYNASGYVTKKFFDYDKGNSILDGFRACVIIDYTKIKGSDFFTFYDEDNGFANTESFITGLSNANVFAFENALASTTKTESGHEGELAFRIPYSGVDNDYILADVNEGRLGITISNSPYTDAKNRTYEKTFNNAATMDDMSGILKYIIQRNNFNVVRKTVGQNYYYEIDLDTDNIKWYLPAVNQYKDPVLSFATGNTTFTPANFWSSTADEKNNSNAFLGDGTSVARTNTKQVVVQRIVTPIPQPTTISDISTEEMKGGENGEAQWVE